MWKGTEAVSVDPLVELSSNQVCVQRPKRNFTFYNSDDRQSPREQLYRFQSFHTCMWAERLAGEGSIIHLTLRTTELYINAYFNIKCVKMCMIKLQNEA